jgi:hypothetical protein
MFIVGDLSIPDQDAQSTIQQYIKSRSNRASPGQDERSFRTTMTDYQSPTTYYPSASTEMR